LPPSPRITTIVPTFRRPALLRRALRSVAAQTVPDFLVCVYDNAADPQTESVVATMRNEDPRFAYFRHDRDVGAMNNFLFGMRRVATPFFSFLSDDDVLLHDFFETALAGFETCERAMMSITSAIEVDPDGAVRYAPLARWSKAGAFEPPDGAFRMLDNRHPTWTTVLFRREAIERVGELDAQIGSPADLDYELRVAVRYPIVVSLRPCGAYVAHSGSASMQESTATVAGYERMCRNIAADESLAATVRRRLASRLLRQIRMKLVELWVKGLVRGDDGTALDAANEMGKRNRFAGALLLAAWRLCTQLSVCRAALRFVERTRLQTRARASGRVVTPEAFAQIRKALEL
jgi:GT2 family glycosyltransferase